MEISNLSFCWMSHDERLTKISGPHYLEMMPPVGAEIVYDAIVGFDTRIKSILIQQKRY